MATTPASVEVPLSSRTSEGPYEHAVDPATGDRLEQPVESTEPDVPLEPKKMIDVPAEEPTPSTPPSDPERAGMQMRSQKKEPGSQYEWQKGGEGLDAIIDSLEGGPGSGPTGTPELQPEQTAMKDINPNYNAFKPTPKRDRLQTDPELSRMTEGGPGSGRKSEGGSNNEPQKNNTPEFKGRGPDWCGNCGGTLKGKGPCKRCDKAGESLDNLIDKLEGN